MGQRQYLIDTNSVIDYLSKKLPEAGMNFTNDVIDGVPNVSVITKIELLDFIAPEKHEHLLRNFINDVLVLDLTNSVVDECIQIRKKPKSKLPDAIIAATALVYDLMLITHNIADFKDIKGLFLIDPHDLQSIEY